VNDVLVLTIPLRAAVRERVAGEWKERPARYPSVNHAGVGAARFGRKTPDYVALAADVEAAGRAAVDAGWTTIDHPCRCWITRYVPDARLRDALNLGQCEANALTRAGVWTDDTLAGPITLDVQPRSDPPDRVVIVVQRLTPAPGSVPRAARPPQEKRKRSPRSDAGAPRADHPHFSEQAPQRQKDEALRPSSRVERPELAGWRYGDPLPAGYNVIVNGRPERMDPAEVLELVESSRSLGRKR
jgi:hypothetical protein